MGIKSILWIEDDAFNELGKLATPVYYEGEYDLQFAVTVTEAFNKLRETEYDAVVVDVRLPPGDDPRWIKIYYKAAADNKAARLGVRLLQSLLGRDKDWTSSLPLAARDPKLYGVLSMDSWEDIRADLEPVGVTLYRNKNEGSDVLLTIIQDILSARNGGGDYVS